MSAKTLSFRSRVGELGTRLMEWSTTRWETDERLQRWIRIYTYVLVGLWVFFVLLSPDIFAQGGGGGGGGTGGGGGIGASRAQAQQALNAGRSLVVIMRWGSYLIGGAFVLWGFGTMERNGWIKVLCGGLIATWELWLSLATIILSGGYTDTNDLPDLRRP